MTDNYETDIWLANLFRGWNDPCPLGGLEDGKDGLVESWKINTFVNPPYSNIMPWVQKAIYECEQINYSRYVVKDGHIYNVVCNTKASRGTIPMD